MFGDIYNNQFRRGIVKDALNCSFIHIFYEKILESIESRMEVVAYLKQLGVNRSIKVTVDV